MPIAGSTSNPSTPLLQAESVSAVTYQCPHQDHSDSLKDSGLICTSVKLLASIWRAMKGSEFIRILAFQKRTSIPPGMCFQISDRCKIAPEKSLLHSMASHFRLCPPQQSFHSVLCRERRRDGFIKLLSVSYSDLQRVGTVHPV